MAPLSIWIITNGRRGDIVQCRAIAEKLIEEKGGKITEKEMHPRFLWRFSAPYSFLDPQDKNKLQAPYPDLIIASGRRSVPAVRYIHQKTNGQCKTVFMKHPGIDTSKFGLSWVPTHDRREGTHIISTLTSPHLITAKRTDSQKVTKNSFFKNLESPTLGIILGGNSVHVTYNETEIDNFIKPLKEGLPFASYLITGSRRTPKELLLKTEKALSNHPHSIWKGDGENPYFDILKASDAFYVTGDSHNMVSEVLAMGKKTYVYNPSGNAEKFAFTLKRLEKENFISLKLDQMEPGHQPPLDATGKIVDFIKEKLDF